MSYRRFHHRRFHIGAFRPAQAWELVVASLAHFAPPKPFENFLAYFIRTYAPERMRDKLEMLFHTSIYKVCHSDLQLTCRRPTADYPLTCRATNRSNHRARSRAPWTGGIACSSAARSPAWTQ